MCIAVISTWLIADLNLKKSGGYWQYIFAAIIFIVVISAQIIWFHAGFSFWVCNFAIFQYMDMLLGDPSGTEQWP